MSQISIEASGLSKQYRIGGKRQKYTTLRDTITEIATAPYHRFKAALRGDPVGKAGSTESIWAMKDLSFQINAGEVVGVIGRNGAGKSTLLKVLSRITEPTHGWANIHGRVGSLLEVGTGFHPELTGRENIYLNGAILGMRRFEIDRRFDEIVAFSEVDKFIDTQVKFYSSGMYLRLAFAVAAHLEPEILLVDEVLAVGDAGFQRKCLGKMGSVANEGRTVLFVSHNLTAVRTLCSRVIWLGGGELVEDGESAEVVTRYLRGDSAGELENVWHDPEKAPGGKLLRLHKAKATPMGEDGIITVQTPIELEFELWVKDLQPDMRWGVQLYNLEDLCVFSAYSPVEPAGPGLVRRSCVIPGDLLNDGVYRVRFLGAINRSRTVLDYGSALRLDVADGDREGVALGKIQGVLRPKIQWSSPVRVGPLP